VEKAVGDHPWDPWPMVRTRYGGSNDAETTSIREGRGLLYSETGD
jgi:hypothetical protein